MAQMGLIYGITYFFYFLIHIFQHICFRERNESLLLEWIIEGILGKNHQGKGLVLILGKASR